jgi:hypothetical protein
VRRRELAFAELMIPIVKGWNTEVAQKTAYLGVQVHGGMGYIEESGAAQYVRDARITTIYEGTTGIQANDLIGRKIARDGGRTLVDALDALRGVRDGLRESGSAALATINVRLGAAIDALDDASRWIVSHYREDPRTVLAGAGPFLELAGLVFSGGELSRASLLAQAKLDRGGGDTAFLQAKVATARHFADHCLTHAAALRDTVMNGAASVLALAENDF